ncbi:acyltransferase [Roseibium salinum]|nr:acyltransferase [Roseibium salinum]
MRSKSNITFFFPFLLLVLVRLRASLATLFLVVAFILSIGLAQILIDQGQKLTAFYLLPSRVWEILAGVLCALASRKGLADRIVGKVAEILAGIGLVLVMVSIPVFNDNTVTPGPHALIPVVGTALILMFSRSGGRVYRILSNKPLVFIGLISFSAYLWHQPLFAFARLSVDEPLSPAIMGALCLIVVPLSYLSWRFVEVPFRNRATVTLPGFIGTGLPLTAALVLVSVVGIRNYGYIYYRYPEDVASTYETVLRSVNYDFDAAMYDNGDCVFSSRSIKGKTEERFADCVQRYGPATIVIGDSHGMNISNILAKKPKRMTSCWAWPLTDTRLTSHIRRTGTTGMSCPLWSKTDKTLKRSFITRRNRHSGTRQPNRPPALRRVI